MGQDLISIQAGESRMDVSTAPREAVYISGWDLGDAEMAATLSQGLDGGVRNGPADWPESRTVTVDLDCSYGNVPGDASGRAINRALTGRAVQSVQAASAGDISVQFGVDASDKNPTTVDMACEVRSSMAGTVHLEALRAGVVVATTSRTVTADGVGRNGIANPRFASGAAYWISDASAGMTVVNSAVAEGPTSAPAWRLNGTNTTASLRYLAVAAAGTSADWVPVVAGQSRTFLSLVHPVTAPGAGGGLRFNVDWKTAGGAAVSSSTSSVTALTTGIPQTVTFSATAPATAAFARVSVQAVSILAESFDVWMLATGAGDIDYIADGDSPGWAWDDVAAPHACSSRRVTGAWSRIELPSASIPGTGVLTFRARLASATAGTWLESRNPVFGEGLNGVYHDQYTPGATGTAQGRSVRPANGEAWANAFVAGVSQVVGAARQDGSPTLVRTADDLAESATLDIQRASAPAAQDGKHAMGYGTCKVSLGTSPLWRLTPRVWPGTVTNTAVGAMPVWRASLPIPGDDEAIGSAAVTWADTRRDALVSVSAGMPVAASGTSTIPAWTTPTETGMLGTYVLRAPSVVTVAAPVAEYTSTVAGRCLIDQRLLASAPDVGPVAVSLVVDGRLAKTVQVRSIGQPDVVTQPWRWASFGPHILTVGSRIQVMLGDRRGVGVEIDILSITPAPAAAAFVSQADEGVPSGSVAGDDFPPVSWGASGAVDARVGTLGGTWSAPGWSYDLYGAFGTGSARLSTTATLGTVQHCAVDARGSLSAAGDEIGLFATSGTAKLVVGRNSTSTELELRINNGATAIVIPLGLPDALTGPSDPYDFRVQVDVNGRIAASVAPPGGALRVAARAHVPAFSGVTFKAGADSVVGTSISVNSLRLLYGTTLPYDSTVEWEAGQSSRLISGGTPRFEPGTRPYVFARAAATAIDSPASPHPTNHVVTITPRVLQVPR